MKCKESLPAREMAQFTIRIEIYGNHCYFSFCLDRSYHSSLRVLSFSLCFVSLSLRLYFLFLYQKPSQTFCCFTKCLTEKSRKSVHHLKGILQPKMKMLSLVACPHVVAGLWKLRSSLEHNLRYFGWAWGLVAVPLTAKWVTLSGSREVWGALSEWPVCHRWFGRDVVRRRQCFLCAKKTQIMHHCIDILENMYGAQAAYSLLWQLQHTNVLFSLKLKCKCM